MVPLDRAAQRAAVLVLLQGRLGGGEEVGRLPRVVAVELPRAAAPVVAPRLGDDVDDRAGVAAELRIVGVREDLELLNRVRRRTQHEPGVEGVVVRRAVEATGLTLFSPAAHKP